MFSVAVTEISLHVAEFSSGLHSVARTEIIFPCKYKNSFVSVTEEYGSDGKLGR